jgi:hypothetical protein
MLNYRVYLIGEKTHLQSIGHFLICGVITTCNTIDGFLNEKDIVIFDEYNLNPKSSKRQLELIKNRKAIWTYSLYPETEYEPNNYRIDYSKDLLHVKRIIITNKENSLETNALIYQNVSQDVFLNYFVRGNLTHIPLLEKYFKKQTYNLLTNNCVKCALESFNSITGINIYNGNGLDFAKIYLPDSCHQAIKKIQFENKKNQILSNGKEFVILDDYGNQEFIITNDDFKTSDDLLLERQFNNLN